MITKVKKWTMAVLLLCRLQLLKVVEGRLLDCSNTESLCAMVLILGECGDLVDTGPYLIEHVLRDRCNRSPICGQLLTSLLTASSQLFLRCPAQYQHVLGHVLELCMNSSDSDVHDKASFYYVLLSTDFQLATRTILSSSLS